RFAERYRPPARSQGPDAGERYRSIADSGPAAPATHADSPPGRPAPTPHRTIRRAIDPPPSSHQWVGGRDSWRIRFLVTAGAQNEARRRHGARRRRIAMTAPARPPWDPRSSDSVAVLMIARSRLFVMRAVPGEYVKCGGIPLPHIGPYYYPPFGMYLPRFPRRLYEKKPMESVRTVGGPGLPAAAYHYGSLRIT